MTEINKFIISKIITVLLVLGVLFAVGAQAVHNKKTRFNQNAAIEDIQNTLKDIQKNTDEIERTLQKKVDIEKQSTSAKQQVRDWVIVGNASTYSERGCLGCDSKRIMANGQKLDDDRRTVAIVCRFIGGRCRLVFALNTRVQIMNTKTGVATVATVTDTFGGIHGRVADLSVATAKAIGCTGTPCPIKMKGI